MSTETHRLRDRTVFYCKRFSVYSEKITKKEVNLVPVMPILSILITLNSRINKNRVD